MKLNEIKDNKGARRKSKNLGRGIGSGKGKTSGRGQKGQKSRTGVAIKGFEGGQMSIFHRLPKRGFKNPFREDNIRIINLDTIQELINLKKLDVSQPITKAILKSLRILKGNQKIKILAKGDLNVAVNIEADCYSAEANNIISALGGKISISQ